MVCNTIYDKIRSKEEPTLFLQHRTANLQFDWLISVVNKSTYNDADAGCVRELEMNNGLRSRT